MRMLSVDPLRPDREPIEEAAAVLRRGGLVAFPTETVYGLGANALDEEAVRRIFAAKGRPSYNPLIVHVADRVGARTLTEEWPDAAEQLARAFWPGPLTLVLRKRPEVPDIVTATLPNVAIRVPAHPVALALLRAAALPVAAPSANRFTEVSPTTARHVAKSLGEHVELILDAGATTVGIESTVVDLTGPRPVLLRPGLLSARDLEPLVGTLDAPVPVASEDAPRAAPGMIERHYAPRATVHLFGAAEREGTVALVREVAAAGTVVGALLLHPLDDAPLQYVVTMPDRPAAYARRLYAALHALDDAGCGVILVERVPDDPAWAGVRDRIERGAR